MAVDLSIRALAESDYDRWTRFVADSASGSIYALPAYLDILCGATGGRFSIMGVFQGDELVGGMPLYLQKTSIGETANRRALLTYHSPVIRDYATAVPSARIARHSRILDALERALRNLNCLHIALHVRHPIADVRSFLAAMWQVVPHYSYLVAIADPAVTWQRIAQNQRRLITRAESLGITVADDDDYAGFYRLHCEIAQRKRVPIYLSEAAFCTYLQRLRDQDLGRLYHARLPDGCAVATQLVLTGPHPVTHTVCAASDEAYLATGANPFLRWKVFESLAQSGYCGNDLTGAPYHHDVNRFKMQLGGELVTNWLITRPRKFQYRVRHRVKSLLKRTTRLVRKIRQR